MLFLSEMVPPLYSLFSHLDRKIPPEEEKNHRSSSSGFARFGGGCSRFPRIFSSFVLLVLVLVQLQVCKLASYRETWRTPVCGITSAELILRTYYVVCMI
jgi:hypothetical protein